MSDRDRGHDQPGDIEGEVAAFRALLAGSSPEDLAAALGAFLEAPAPSRRRARRAEAVTYLVRVVLDEVEPPVWRLVKVPSSTALDELHHVLQAAMGWTNSHLHCFAAGEGRDDPRPERYLTDFDIEEGDEGLAEADVHLDELLVDPGDHLFYTYDFGDGWDHTLTLEAVEPCDDEPPIRCLDGARACPPEDCGGPHGYTELLETARAAASGLPVDAGEAELLRLTFPGRTPAEVLEHAEAFDLAHADDAVAWAAGTRRPGAVGRGTAGRRRTRGGRTGVGRTGVGSRGKGKAPSQPEPGELPEPVVRLLERAAGPDAGALAEMVLAARLDEPVLVDAGLAARMVEPFAWLVGHVGVRGVELTSAGYLRPADVSAVAEHLRLADEWIGTLNREVHTPPVLEFRRACQAAGLLRLAKGRLSATRQAATLAGDRASLWWHLAGRLPLGRRDVEQDAGAVLLLATAAGGGDEDRLAAGLSALGWTPRGGGRVEPWHVRRWAGQTGEVLHRLGAYPRAGFGWSRTPTPEGVAFARAALRAWG
jgi:hypothetical protein